VYLYGAKNQGHDAPKYSVTCNTRLGVVQGYWNWHCLIDHIRLSIGPPL